MKRGCQIRGNSCNSCLLFAFFAFFAVKFLLVNCAAATNDLASALQKGLFEEEANRNFPAAIEAYQGVINRFDEDRKLAATAIFRVGEIYRKQGKTNEANAQYERVVREFSDQSTLATLSQSYLASSTTSSINPPRTNLTSESLLTSDEAEEVKKIRALIRDSPDLINARDQGGNTRLHTVAFLGHLVVARFLVENGADINAQNRSGWTPLNTAVNGGHKALVELCLSHGANVQTPDSDGNTALHIAARRGFRSIVELLLTHGADINAKTKSGSTPLHLAAANGFKSVGELLISHGADVNSLASETRDSQERSFVGTPLHIATARDDQPLAELLLAHNADSNATNNAGETTLHIAAQLSDPKLAGLLLTNKAVVDPINNNGETPLDLCAKSGHTPTAALLLAHGAEVNASNPVERGWKGWTPLLYAVGSGQKDTAALLLNNKANPNAKIQQANATRSKGATPLLIAVSQIDSDIVRSLLNSKADPNLKDDSGLTPARATMNYSDPSQRKHVLSLLLEHGADTENRDSEGKTLLMSAVERKDKELIELLLAHRADPNARQHNQWRNTALHYAVFSISSADSPEVVPNIVEVLLAAGANPNLQTTEGKTPLNYVNPVTLAGAKIRELLIAHGAIADLPRLDSIGLRRPDANFSKVVFTKGTNGWDQFTLFDLLGTEYKLLTASPTGESIPASYTTSGTVLRDRGLSFPDFAQVRIRHPNPELTGWNVRRVDIAAALTSGECSADIHLELGDQVEIPEADHILGANWEGLSKETVESLKKCLARKIAIVIKGQSKTITLTAGGIFEFSAQPMLTLAPFMIKPALKKSNVLLASSDLSHIKLIRADLSTGQKRELIVDCSDDKPAPYVWLRDGDIIEVPDKP
jgi:ankyrin repeat protein